MKLFKENKSKGLSKEAYTQICIVLLGIIICATIVFGLLKTSNSKNSNKATSESSLGYVEGTDYSDSKITTYMYDHTVLHGSDIEKVTQDMNDVLAYMKSHNAYIRVQVDEEEFDYYIYNNNNECLAQSADGYTSVVFRDNDESVAFGSGSGDVLLGNDADLLHIIENVVKIAGTDTEDRSDVTVFHMTKSGEVESPDTLQEYRVEIVGESAFKEIYENINDELGENIIATLKEQISQISENEYVPHVIYTFLFDTETKYMSVACQLVVDEEEHINWIMDGYLELSDWKLDEAWYNSDFSILTSDEAFELLEGLMLQMQEIINKYAEENSITMKETGETYEELDDSEIESSTESENSTSSENLEKNSEEEININTEIDSE